MLRRLLPFGVNGWRVSIQLQNAEQLLGHLQIRLIARMMKGDHHLVR